MVIFPPSPTVSSRTGLGFGGLAVGVLLTLSLLGSAPMEAGEAAYMLRPGVKLFTF